MAMRMAHPAYSADVVHVQGNRKTPQALLLASRVLRLPVPGWLFLHMEDLCDDDESLGSGGHDVGLGGGEEIAFPDD